MYSRPIAAAMNSPMHSTIFSGRKTLMTSSRWKSVIASPSGAGSTRMPHGSSASCSGFHAETSPLTAAGSSARPSTRSAIVQIRTHCA